MTSTRPRMWREVERRPVRGSSPDDRMRRGPDCYRPKRACADPFPATPWPRLPKTHRTSGMRFRRHAESIGPMWLSKPKRGAASRRSAPRPSQKDATGGTATPCSSFAMSSDRLFLDRVARQHCPSPLHRHGQTTMHSRLGSPKPDISTLQRIGHFYFALTRNQGPRFSDTKSGTGRSAIGFNRSNCRSSFSRPCYSAQPTVDGVNR